MAGLQLAGAAPAAKPMIKGVGYSPVPLKGHGHIPLDDFMSEVAKPLWSPRGRDDLGIMRLLGANSVRTYGNDPRQDHREFLEAARAAGLHVMVGQSDWPFMQMRGNCMEHSDLDCYTQVKESYLGNLRRGFLSEDGSYDQGLSYLVVVNEPDLKLPGIDDPRKFCRAIISAVDAIADAEKEMNVTGRLIDLTVAFSFAVCKKCRQPSVGEKPALGQMLELRNAFLHPDQYGYAPRNDLAALYASRFINCFNTQNPATEIRQLFLDAYEANFPSVPVVVGEYHSAEHKQLDQLKDLEAMLKIVESSPLLLGIFYFEFQVRYDKGGSEEDFGMFGLGDFVVAQLEFFTASYPVWCLKRVVDPASSTRMALPAEVTAAYGGEGVDLDGLCVPNPHKVPLTESGFREILKQGVPQRMAVFVERTVEHSGGKAPDPAAVLAVARGLSSFEGLLALIRSHPPWASWDPYAACVADRQSDTASLGRAIELACHRAWFDCGNLPAECKEGIWLKADYILSVYHNEVSLQNESSSGPLSTCYFNGSAIFARSAIYRAEDTTCVVTRDPRTTTLTDEGFQAILRQKKPSLNAVFFERVVRERLLAEVSDDAQLRAFAEDPPSSMYDLLRLLRAALWVCAGDTGRPCPPPGRIAPSGPEELWWRKWAFVALAAVVLITVLCTCVYVRMPKRWLQRRKAHRTLAGGSSGSSDSESSSEGT